MFFSRVFNGASIGTASSGCTSKVAAIGRCLLRDVPLYMNQYLPSKCYILDFFARESRSPFFCLFFFLHLRLNVNGFPPA